MATPIHRENIGKHPNSLKNRFRKGHAAFIGVESGWFKKGIQNNPNGGFKKGHTPWNKGKPHMVKEKHPAWRGGITPLNVKIRNSPRMKEWRAAVFKRDGYTCVLGGKEHGNKLEADHIKRFSDYPELRFDINNGRTLCVNCHKRTDTYGNKLQTNR